MQLLRGRTRLWPSRRGGVCRSMMGADGQSAVSDMMRSQPTRMPTRSSLSAGSCLQNLRFLREEGVKEELKYSFKVNLALGLLLENAMVAPHFPANRVRAPKIRGIG